MMAGVVLVGVTAFRQLPVSALPQVDYPTIQIQTFYPGASPEVVTSSITAPLEKQFGQVPGLTQMTSISSFSSSLITLQFSLDLSIDVAEQEVQAAINAATTFLPKNLPVPPIYSKTNPADAPILTLAITSIDGAAAESRRAGGNAHGAEDFPAQRRGSGEHQRRAASGRPGAGESHRAGILWTEPGVSANGAGQRQREPGQRQFRWTGPGLDHQRQRPASGRRPVRADHHRLPQWGARAHSRRRHGHRRRGKHQAGRLGERRPGHRSEYSAAARDQHHQRGRYGAGDPSSNRSVSAGGDPACRSSPTAPPPSGHR